MYSDVLMINSYNVALFAKKLVWIKKILLQKLEIFLILKKYCILTIVINTTHDGWIFKRAVFWYVEISSDLL